MSEIVHIRHVQTVAVIEIDRPQRRNALSLELLDELSTSIDAAMASTTGIVLTGSNGTFSAGADFTDLTGTSADIAFDDTVSALTDKIATSDVPIVAALEGPCIGAAAHIALTCDARVAGSDSYIRIPAVELGVLYNPGALAYLARALPRDTIRRLFLLAERFDATEAIAAGLVSRVVRTGTAEEHAVAMLSALRPEHRTAAAATRSLLRDFDTNRYDDNVWQSRRRELLDSPTRASAVARAHRQHENLSQDHED